ncbi:LCP family protein [Candidatus Dojkabacteria bacterium]|nr:LCP family protein [Candidatus Dojkabacteria bacterium]
MGSIFVDLDKKRIIRADSKKEAKKNFNLDLSKIFLVLSFFGLLFLNVWLISQYTREQRDPMQAFASVIETSVKVVDTVWKPELPSTKGYTGVLVMGIDTRNLSYSGEEFNGDSRNIDTIIQVVYDHSNGNVFMLSIPRDTGVTVTEECAGQNPGKRSIHFLYDLGEKGSCPGGGVGLMKKYVTDITGFENHYFAIISLEAFVDIIDAIGDTNESQQKGLYMDIPKNTYELYPKDRGGYESIFFPEGYQFLTSERLLKYARARQYSSDFDRARRQQEVIKAVKDKVLSSDTLLDPIKLFELYNSFKRNAMFSEIGLTDIKAGLSILTKVDQDKIYDIVLDDTLGGKNQYLSRPVTSGGIHSRSGYYLTPVDYKVLEDDYENIRNFVQAIVKHPDLSGEKAVVYVYATKYSGNKVVFENNAYQMLKQMNIPIEINESRNLQKLADSSSEIEIYDFSNGSKPETIKLLEKKLKVKSKTPTTAKPLNKEDITIIIKTGN